MIELERPRRAEGTEIRATGELLIKGGRLIDPSRGVDEMGDLLVADGRVVGFGGERRLTTKSGRSLDATGYIVCPGFVDLHAHLREPGEEHKETIATGSAAAAAGGFTTVCCLPDTDPTIDNRAGLERVLREAVATDLVRVLVVGAITKGRKGKELSEMADLARAGVVGFSDDDTGVADGQVMRNALQYASMLGLPVIQHCEDRSLSHGAPMHEGPVAARLGLRGSPAIAETAMLARDLSLVELTGARFHAAHLSVAGSVELIRRAKERGLAVTAEVTPHHLLLTDDLVAGAWALWRDGGRSLRPYDTCTKVSPPLRRPEDAETLLAGLRDGTIDAIATDHAPHALVDKQCEYDDAAFGISGLDTALAALCILVEQGKLDYPTLIERLTVGPARALGREYGRLCDGAVADVTVFDPNQSWKVDPAAMRSLGKNTPFLGVRLRGKTVATLRDGKPIFGGERFV